MKNYFIYILTNQYNTVLYIGVTNNLERRIYEHKNKLVEGFTSKYNLNKLVYFEEFGNIDDAITSEKKIKGWVRKKKNVLIESKNLKWEDLSLSF
jgi:putative endonuclease